MKDQLVFPLNEKTAREWSTQSGGERGVIDAIVHLDEHGLGAHQATEQKEGKGHCGARRDDDVGTFPPQNSPRETKVLDQVRDVAGRGIEGPITALRFEKIMTVWHVERDPESVVVLPPGFENEQMSKVSAGRTNESDFERFIAIYGKGW